MWFYVTGLPPRMSQVEKSSGGWPAASEVTLEDAPQGLDEGAHLVLAGAVIGREPAPAFN